MLFFAYLLGYMLISVLVLLSISMVAYDMSPFKELSPQKTLSLRRRTTYYLIAAYPVLSFIGVLTWGVLFSSPIDTAPEMRGLFQFCSGNFLLCIPAVTVARYLRKRHKANVLFIAGAAAAGGLYLYIGLWAGTELLKH